MNDQTPASTKDAQRLFIAVPLPDALKRTVGAWIREIRGTLSFRKWTDEADLHITLQFLGDTAPERIPELKANLASAAGSGKIHPFRLSLDVAGSFGRLGQPRVLWVGIGGELEWLSELQRSIVKATAPLGFAAEDRPYRPHLTVARSYTGQQPFSLPEPVRAENSGGPSADGPSEESFDRTRSRQHASGGEGDPLSWLADEFVLYRTHMGSRPMYETAARFPLGN